MELELDATERITLFQTLPANVGSLKQSLKTKKLRNRLLTEDFKESIEWQERAGQVQFDPSALPAVPPKTFQLDEEEEEIIAWGFLHDGEEGDVSTDNSYTRLLEVFWDKIQELQSDE